MRFVEYIVYIKGHKNSKGESAPWVIRSHKDHHIISSHHSEEDAKEHLRQMHVFANIFEKVYNRFNEGDCCSEVCGSGATLAGSGDSGISAFAPENAVSVNDGNFGQSSIATESRTGAPDRTINYSKKKKMHNKKLF